MKKKKGILGIGLGGFFSFFFIIIIMVVSAAGGGAEAQSESYSQNISVYEIAISNAAENNDGYEVKLNEIAWYYMMTGIEPIQNNVIKEANWIAKNKSNYEQIAKHYKNVSPYKENLQKHSVNDLVAYIDGIEEINESREEIDDEDITVEGGSEEGRKIVEKALTRLGYMYKCGGCHTEKEIKNPNQKLFDCSGLVNRSFYQCGYNISASNTTKTLVNMGKLVSRSHLSPGDIILFSNNGKESGVHHVGIYKGDGNMVHAPRTGKPIQVSNITTGYYAREYYCARRLY